VNKKNKNKKKREQREDEEKRRQSESNSQPPEDETDEVCNSKYSCWSTSVCHFNVKILWLRIFFINIYLKFVLYSERPKTGH
jgi:hypothetical protein